MHMERQNALRVRVAAILGPIALLRDSLSPRDLEFLTRIPCQDTMSVLYQLRSVVLFDREKPDEPFRPMHVSFPQFLVDPARYTNPLYLVSTKRQHARLVGGCLGALTSLKRNVIGLEDDTHTRVHATHVPDLAAYVRKYFGPHVWYACVHWAAHLTKAERTEGLWRVLGGSWAGRMLMWLETLG